MVKVGGAEVRVTVPTASAASPILGAMAATSRNASMSRRSSVSLAEARAASQSTESPSANAWTNDELQKIDDNRQVVYYVSRSPGSDHSKVPFYRAILDGAWHPLSRYKPGK